MKRITHAEAKNDLDIMVMHSDDDSALRAAERLECYIEQHVGVIPRNRRMKMSERITHEFKPCPFCGGVVDPQGWLGGDGRRGPECEDCGASATSIETWQQRSETELEREKMELRGALWDLLRIMDGYAGPTSHIIMRARAIHAEHGGKEADNE